MKLPSLEGGQRVVGDALSLTVLFGTLVNWLPAVASVITIIWTIICIVESRTFQWLIGRAPVRPAVSE